MQSLSCSNCGAPLELTDEPTLRCKQCGSVLVNPFYKASDKADAAPLMPQINININAATPPVRSYTPDQPFAPVSGQPVPSTTGAERSSKNWYVTTGLCLFLGVFGVHRFYTGNFIIGAIQFFTLGLGGLWTLLDFFLLLSGQYVDGDGKRVAPPWGRKFSLGVQIAIVIALLVLGCMLCFGTLVLVGSTVTPTSTPVSGQSAPLEITTPGALGEMLSGTTALTPTAAP